MSRLTRDGTDEPVSRDQVIRHARGQGNIHFPCPADHEQPYPVDPYSAICDDHTYMLETGVMLFDMQGQPRARKKTFSLTCTHFFYRGIDSSRKLNPHLSELGRW